MLDEACEVEAFEPEHVSPHLGHADADGTPDINDSLSVSRANLVRSAVERLQLSNLNLSTKGLGSRDPLTRDASDTDKRTNRRVTIRLAAQ